MIVYHGSNSCFKNLRIHPSLVKHNSTMLNEGLGIYFATDKEVATSYGKYLYTLEINNNYFSDFRVLSVCKKYIQELVKYIYLKEKVDISKYFDANIVAQYMVNGGIAISGVGREVYMLLDSNEKWYFRNQSSTIERVYKLLSKYDQEHLFAYMFTYHIQNIGVIKSVESNIVRIVSRDRLY